MSEQAGKDKIQHTVTGKVVSSKTAKTIAVEISRTLKHPQYGKYIRRTTRLLAHDEAGRTSWSRSRWPPVWRTAMQ